MTQTEINIEILRFNYWEHIKAEKALSFVLPPDNYKRIAIHDSANTLLKNIDNEIKSTH